jgi:energy-coupling factor transport system permease protein
VALALAGFILVNPLELAIVLLLVLATLAAARRLRQALPYLKVALYVGLFLALLNPLFSGAGLDVLWEAHLPLLHVRLTLQGIYFGLGTALRLAVVVSAFALWSVAVDPDDQLALLTRFSFRSGLVVSLATRLFPVLSRDGQRIADAQRCRAVELDRGGRRERAARRIPLLSALLTQSLERAVDVAAAMEARGFGRRGRTRWDRRRAWRAADVVGAASSAAAAAALLAALLAGRTRFAYFPLSDDPWPRLADPWFLAVAGLLALPLLLEARWRR